MEPEPVIYREEVTAILIVLGDINVKLQQMLDLWEDVLGEDPEGDT